VRAGGGLQEGQRAGGELVLLDESDLIFPVECKISFFAPAVCTSCACVKNVMGDSGRRKFRDAGVVDNPADLRSGRNRGEMRLLRNRGRDVECQSRGYIREFALRLVEQVSVGLVSLAYTMSHRSSTH
jgi:hypothetical protein